MGVAGTFSKESFLLRFPGLPIVHGFAELLDLFDVPAAVAASV